MSDLISAKESVAKIVDTAIRKVLSGEQKLTKEYEQSIREAVDVILDTARREHGKAEAQPERKKGKWTKDCACEICGFKPWYERDIHTLSFCPNCGADMREDQTDDNRPG